MAKMIKKKGAIPLAVQDEIEKRVNDFNKKYLLKKHCLYAAEVKDKFIYLSYDCGDGDFEKVCRLTYSNSLENMVFAIYVDTTGKYDVHESDFNGNHLVDGTLEGAMQAGLKAYPI